MKRICALVMFLLMVMGGSAFALPVAGDTAVMTGSPNFILTVGDDSWNTFCLEKDEYITEGEKYIIESMTDHAILGGGGAVDEKDPISNITKWLYATFVGDEKLATKVQNAIWYEEKEIGVETDLLELTKGITDFSISEFWDIKVANLEDDVGNYMQSQLIGEYAPVPEPATMVLFGMGLLGFAGISRKQKNIKEKI